MIDEVLTFFREHLNAAFASDEEPGAGGSVEDKVIFPEGEKLRENVEFKLGAVTVLLISLEEETTLRPGDRFVRIAPDGSRQRISPEVRLNLQILFVSHYKQYGDSLKYLSRVIHHFQKYRVFDHANTPELPDRIEQLLVELVTLTFAEQNEIWGMLRTSPRPSALYKVRMIVFEDRSSTPAPRVEELDLRLPS